MIRRKKKSEKRFHRHFCNSTKSYTGDDEDELCEIFDDEQEPNKISTQPKHLDMKEIIWGTRKRKLISFASVLSILSLIAFTAVSSKIFYNSK